MKALKLTILVASLFAIAGAALFQLLVLLKNAVFTNQAFKHQVL
ncbi:MAG: hypothetical protein NTV66_07830 [Methylococcales bacterium]|jgi:hypothetical protein|nr:hypothetical protein [Methylococcales bacterium]